MLHKLLVNYWCLKLVESWQQTLHVKSIFLLISEQTWLPIFSIHIFAMKGQEAKCHHKHVCMCLGVYPKTSFISLNQRFILWCLFMEWKLSIFVSYRLKIFWLD